MTHMKNITLKVATSIACLIPLAASADWGLTLNVDNDVNRYEKLDSDPDALASLGIQYRGEKFNIDREALSYGLVNNKKYALELIATSRNDEIDDHRKILLGMDKRKSSIDVGGRALLKTDLGPLSFEATRDVRASKGVTADLKFGGIEPHAAHWNGKREFKIAAVTGVRYQSKKTADYFYGVKPSEATASRAVYVAKATTTPYVGLESQFNITEKISLDAGVIYEHLDDNVRNSSLTDDKDFNVLVNLGVTYWF